MEKELKVIVFGVTNTGKTTVARIIEEALREQNFTDVTVIDLDPSPDKEVLAQRVAALKERKITIQVVPAGRNATGIPPISELEKL